MEHLRGIEKKGDEKRAIFDSNVNAEKDAISHRAKDLGIYQQKQIFPNEWPLVHGAETALR
jgi:hypothetical protein